jgi:hypothetical protein
VECCKKQGQMAEACGEGLGSNRTVVPIMMIMMICHFLCSSLNEGKL